MILTDHNRQLATEALSNLIGLPLTDMCRYAGCQKFEFGEQKPGVNKKGERTTWADWGLVVQCPWSIEGPDGFLLTSEQFAPERRDEHAMACYESLGADPPVVGDIEIAENGAVLITMSDGYSWLFSRKPARRKALSLGA